MTVREIYDRTIRCLPPSERIQLATIILNELPKQAIVDYSEAWSDEDYQDFSRASWDHINARLEEDENA